MRNNRILFAVFIAIFMITGIALLGYGCAPTEPKLVTAGLIPDHEFEPAEWGKVYPFEYESWLKTKDPKPTGKSIYKKGWDTDKIIYDKLSEFPFLALIYKGFGFGNEYNEPRGHYYMLTDVKDIDQSRTLPGGVCLNCKSPYMNSLVKKHGADLYKMKYADALALIPEKHRSLGAACIDCHDNRTMELRIDRHTFVDAMKRIGKPALTRQEKRMAACAQCHVTYIVPKGKNMESTGVFMPWDGSAWGNISIENIIAVIKKSDSHLEWKQKTTGFKMGFIRHPEFEFFTRNSVHYNAGLACADCHMPYQRVGSAKISNHDIMSPLKDDLRACLKCHPQSEQRLKADVRHIQDATASLLNRAGYATAVVARLFETAHNASASGKSVDSALYRKARDCYDEAFYRMVFIGAENSMGFHNPSEALRVLGDSVAYAGRAEALLRQGLMKAGIDIPPVFDLQLSGFLNNRGSKKLQFRAEQEIKDPFGTQKKISQ